MEDRSIIIVDMNNETEFESEKIKMNESVKSANRFAIRMCVIAPASITTGIIIARHTEKETRKYMKESIDKTIKTINDLTQKIAGAAKESVENTAKAASDTAEKISKELNKK